MEHGSLSSGWEKILLQSCKAVVVGDEIKNKHKKKESLRECVYLVNLRQLRLEAHQVQLKDFSFK